VNCAVTFRAKKNMYLIQGIPGLSKKLLVKGTNKTFLLINNTTN